MMLYKLYFKRTQDTDTIVRGGTEGVPKVIYEANESAGITHEIAGQGVAGLESVPFESSSRSSKIAAQCISFSVHTFSDRHTAMSLLEKHNQNVQAACDEYLGENSWDFTLPQIPAPSNLASHLPKPLNDDLGFSLRDLVGAIQGGETCDVIREYLTHFGEILGKETLKERMNSLLDGYPASFFVVATGNAEMVKLWACYSGNVNHSYRGVPVLGFAICLCQSFRKNWPLVVKTLLSLGWSVNVIPRAFYAPLNRDLPDDGPSEDELTDLNDDTKAWCVATIRRRIARALNFSFTVRYDLYLASQERPVSGAKRMVAQVHKASELLGIRYFIVGQTPACRLLPEHFLTHLAMPRLQPLVLLFAGPSGHGKTELARNLGRLLSLDLHNVDCTNLSYESDLFGPWSPYQGWEAGSAVNNYLASHNGQRCLVFMDEFEKTKDEVRQALLLPFESGEYDDRQGQGSINCSKTIWILATNAFDQTIHNFCDNHEAVLFPDHASNEADGKARELMRKLTWQMRYESISVFGAPLTGRITDFIPFLPFSPIEQTAVADKYLAELGRELAGPIDTCEEPARYRPVGNVDLHVKRAYSVNRALAASGYVTKLGARSLINTIDREVSRPIIGSYLDAREEVHEVQPAGNFVVGVDAESGEVEVSQFAVE